MFEFLMALVFCAAMAAWVYFWVVMFVTLMLFGPNDLPWKYDKVIWACIFILLPPAAPFLFWMFKHAYRGALDSERE